MLVMIKAIAVKSALLTMFLLLNLTGANCAQKTIILQSTTSTQNSGLFDYILPLFKLQTGISVNVVSVGTGQALKNGRNGDGDVLLVHAKEAEELFIAQGFGVERFDVMYNDFVIVGPDNDPANINGSTNVITALQNIAASKSPFASRGDNSGTHTKERQLWKLSGIDVSVNKQDWYRETGSGMGATINLSVGLGAYTLTDRATWISFQNKTSLQIHHEGDQLLFNQYGVILINPEKHSHVRKYLALAFINWLTSKDGQDAIGSYKLNGRQLFFPNAK